MADWHWRRAQVSPAGASIAAGCMSPSDGGLPLLRVHTLTRQRAGWGAGSCSRPQPQSTRSPDLTSKTLNEAALFLDGSLLQTSQGLSIRMHTPVIDPEPVIIQEHEWEGTSLNAYNSLVELPNGTIYLYCECLLRGPLLSRQFRTN